jgi:CspA family cold shock protein
MEGTVKWFNIEKGFGFIVVTGRPNDLFFHLSEYRSEKVIQPGDRVSFDVGIGKQNKEAAKNVYFVARGNPIENQKPYYGKPTRESVSGGVSFPGFALAGAAVGALLFGPFGAAAGGLLLSGGFEKLPGQLITSSCLKCGGTGNVTNIDENFIGFQCENCKSFWKKRNKENLSMSKVIR